MPRATVGGVVLAFAVGGAGGTSMDVGEAGVGTAVVGY